MPFTWTGGYTELNPFGNFAANAIDDWDSGSGTSRTGYSTAACAVTSQVGLNSPNFSGNTINFRQATSSGGQIVGALNQTAFSTVDMSTARRVCISHFKYTNPASVIQQAGARVDTIANGGMTITYYSGGVYTNYVRLPVSGYDFTNARPIQTWYNMTIWEAGYTTGALATGGTFDNTDVQDIGAHVKGVSNASNQNSELCRVGYVDPYVLMGSDSGTDPWASFYTKTYTTDDIMVCTRLADTQYKVSCSVTWGDGSDNAFVPYDSANKSIYWPDAPSTYAKGFFCSNGHIGFEINSGAGNDYRNITAVYSFTFPQPMYWRLVYGGTAHSNPSYLTLTGHSVTGASSVVVHAEFILVSMSFYDCLSIDFTDGAVTLTDCTFGGSGVSAANCPIGVLINNFSNVSGCTFQNYDDTAQVALRINGTGPITVNLDNLTFTNNTVDIDWAGTGQLTINVQNGGTAYGSLTITTSGGGTTVDGTTATWHIIHDNSDSNTSFPDGTRYRIVDSVSGELYNQTVSGASGFDITTTTLTAGRVLTLTSMYASGTTIKQGGPWTGVVPAGGGDIDFSANAATTISAAVTWGITSNNADLSANYSTPALEVDTASTQIDRRYIYYFMFTVQATEDGIRNWFNCITANSAVDVVISVSVIPGFQIDNVNSATMNVEWTNTGFSLRLSDDSNPIAEGQTLYSSPAVQIAASAGSGLTSAQAISLANAESNSSAALAQTTDLHALQGLTSGTDLVVTPTSRTAGSISQTITEDGDQVTVSRAA